MSVAFIQGSSDYVDYIVFVEGVYSGNIKCDTRPYLHCCVDVCFSFDHLSQIAFFMNQIEQDDDRYVVDLEHYTSIQKATVHSRYTCIGVIDFEICRFFQNKSQKIFFDELNKIIESLKLIGSQLELSWKKVGF